MDDMRSYPTKLFTSATLTAALVFSSSALVYSFDAGRIDAIKLTARDRAVIIQSVLKDIFSRRRNYEGRYFILSEGIRPEWLPKIPGYELLLVNRKQIETRQESLPYYDVQLRESGRKVRVDVYLYTSEAGKDPEVILYYRFRKVRGKWRGKFWGGAGA